MSSSCPPQLHLSLPANTTSFKRSFEQFGFDLESPGGTEGAGSSGSDGNDRNKRARSESRFSDDTDSGGSSQSSTVASGSSISLTGGESESDVQVALSAARTPDGHGAPHYSLSLIRSSQEPPRLPTPEIQDIEMVDYSSAEAVQSESNSAAAIGGSSGSHTDESYRLSLERFNAFDTQISALRRSHSPAIARSTASPPVLPPLELLGDESRLNTSTIPFMHPPTQSSPPPLPESLYSFGLPLLNRTQRPGPSSTSREDPRILPHETHSQAEGSLTLGVQRQPTPRFSSSPRPTSQHSSPTPHDEPQASTLPFIQFSPNSLWTRYDDSPSPTSDDQEFEFTEFRGSEFVPALELRSSSPLFNELEDDDEFRLIDRPVEHNPPTLPPIHNVWDDPLEDLIGYPSTSPRAGSSGAQAESVASSSRSGTQTQPALDRISTRDLASLRDTEIRSASSSEGDHRDHSLPSPFLPNIGGWMEGENNAPFGMPSDWSSSSTRQNTNNAPFRDFVGPSLSSTGVDLSWTSLRANPSSNGVHQRLLSRNSSASGSRSADGSYPATRAMLNLGYRTQASSSASSVEQDVAIPRRLRLSGTQLGTPLEAQMEPWLSERSRDPPSPEPETQDEGLTPEERISNQLDAIVAATRRTARQFRDYAGSSTYQAQLDELDAMDADARRRQSTALRAVSPPPRISTDTDSLVGPPFPSGPSHTYESTSQSWNESGRGTSPYSTSDTFLSRHNTYSGRSSLGGSSQIAPEQTGTRPAWSWVDNTTVEVQHTPPSPPEPVSSTVSASDLFRMHSRLYDAAHRPSQSTSTTSSPRRSSRYELFTRRYAQSRSPPVSTERSRVGPPFDPDRPPMNYVTMRRRASPPAARPLLFARPQVHTHQSTRVQDYPARQRNPPSGSASSARSSMGESSDSLLEHAMEMESDATRSGATSFPHHPWTRLSAQIRSESERSQAGPRTDFPSIQRRQSVYQGEWLNLSDEELSGPNTHRHAHTLTQLRRDTTGTSSMPDAQRRRQARDAPSRRPESQNLADSVYLDVPSLPSPGLREIFQPSQPTNSSIAERGHHSSPSNDVRSAPRSLVGTQLDQGYRPTTSAAPYSDRSGRPYHPRSFSGRHRSPSPTLEDQGSHRPPPARAGPSATTSSVNRSSMNIDPNSFAPGPFRNTLERLVNINMARESRTGPPPSIPPLPFESNTSQSTGRPMPSMRIDPSPQHSHPTFWPPPQNNTSQTSLTYPEDSPSSEPDEDWGWHQRSYPRRASSLRSAQMNDSPPRQAPVDVHNYLTQRARMEASRIENPGNSQYPHSQPTRGDAEGFSNAIDVIRQDGLSTIRASQLITRFHRNRRNAEPRNPASSERLSSWGIVDHANPNPSDQRTADGPNNVESEAWGSRSIREIAADVLGERNRNLPPVSSGSNGERIGQTRRHIRPARPYEMSSIFGGMMQNYADRFSRRGRALGDYMRDEDFDESYESLLSLAATLGEVKPRATPDEVIAGMDTGLYRDWKTPDSDHRCPICLDDYQPDDALLKLTDCSHWLHRECLQQWLKGASTCPVCRKAVTTTTTTCRAHHNHNYNPSNGPGPSWRRDPPGGSGGGGTFGGRGGADSGGDWPPPWRHTPAP